MTKSNTDKSSAEQLRRASVEVSEDPEFERRVDVGRRIAWGLIGTIVFAALCGAFGRGPLSHARAESADGSVTVRYERIVRAGAPTAIDVQFLGGGPGRREVELSESFFDAMSITSMTPEPSSSFTSAGGCSYVVDVVSVPSSLTLHVDVHGYGRVRTSIRVRNNETSNTAELGVFVLP